MPPKTDSTALTTNSSLHDRLLDETTSGSSSDNRDLESGLEPSESFQSPIPASQSELGVRKNYATALITQQLANHPKKVFSKDIIKPFIFGAVTAACGSFLYYQGGRKKQSIESIVGGIGINYPQSVLYGVGTYHFISSFKCNSWAKLAGAALVGTASTGVQVAASYYQADSDAEKIYGPILTFIGNQPNNIFGMHDFFTFLGNLRDKNPRVRKYLYQKFVEGLDQDLIPQLHGERGTLGNFVGFTLGLVGVGGQLAIGQTGYFCSSIDFAINLVKNISLGVFLGVLTNLPITSIGLLLVGFAFGVTMYDVISNIKDHGLHLTKGDKAQLKFSMANSLIWAYLGWYSSATSETLFEEHCPNFGAMQDFMWSETRYGTMAFNFALAMVASYAVTGRLKIVMDKDPMSQRIYATRATEAYLLHDASSEQLEEQGRTYFLDEKAQWERPDAAKKSLANNNVTLFSDSSSSASSANEYKELDPKPSLCKKLFGRR